MKITNASDLEKWLADTHPGIPHRSNLADYMEDARRNLIHYRNNRNQEMYEWQRGNISGMVKCLLLIGMIEIDEAWMLIGLLTDIEEQRLAGGQGATLDVKMIASRLAHVINSQMLTET